MGSWNVALIDESSAHVALGDVRDIAHALQLQLDHDFSTAWGVHATVRALSHAAKVPQGTWPIRFVDDLDGAGGVHLDRNRKPYAEVVVGSELTVATSHELLEMLVDPWGNRFTPGPSVDPADGGRTVFYLVEVGDPCETTKYEIAGIEVSDFVLPAFFDPHTRHGVDFRGALEHAFDVAPGGYISWIDPGDGRWHQQLPDGSFVTAGVDTEPGANPRDERDRVLGRSPAVR